MILIKKKKVEYVFKRRECLCWQDGNENQTLSLQFYTWLFRRISHRLASSTIHFSYGFFSTTHIFPVVLGTTRYIHIIICSLTLNLSIMMSDTTAQFKVIRVFLEDISTLGWLCKVSASHVNISNTCNWYVLWTNLSFTQISNILLYTRELWLRGRWKRKKQ